MFPYSRLALLLFKKKNIPIINTITPAQIATTADNGRGHVCGIVSVEIISPHAEQLIACVPSENIPAFLVISGSPSV